MCIRFLLAALLCLPAPVNTARWGFFAHQRINRIAVFSLPPEMLALYKPHLEFIAAHAVDPDRRRYVATAEGPRHYIDIDHYGRPPFDSLPRSWAAAVQRYTADTLERYGVLPWHIQRMMARLTRAFQDRDAMRILQVSAELGHYMADAYVPLHACSNHDGQLSGQQGIHALWESRIPELLADREFDYWAGKAVYIADPAAHIWEVIIGSAQAADTVLRLEQALRRQFPARQRYAYERRNGVLTRNYSTAYARAYQRMLGNMVETRMRGAIASVASCWYTAWVNAGQPPLQPLAGKALNPAQLKALKTAGMEWRQQRPAPGRAHE